MRSFKRWFSINVQECIDNVTIHCSASPAMYIRVQESIGNDIKVINIALHKDNFHVPRIFPRREYDDDYDDVYKYDSDDYDEDYNDSSDYDDVHDKYDMQ